MTITSPARPADPKDVAAVTNWIESLKGRFIVLDGPDGSGKSTQFARLAAAVREAGLAVREVREPGGTPIGEQIRRVLLDPANAEMDVRCELLLYMASRAQLVAQEIAPALARGELVLADRFLSSTLAYQGAAGGLERDDILRIGHFAIGACRPDLVVILDVDERVASTRLNPLLDRMERKGAEFHRRVREGFLQQAREMPGTYAVIDAAPAPADVARALLTELERRLGSA